MNSVPHNLHGLTLEELSRALAETADSVMICDAAGRIKFVNRAFERLTGYSNEEARGRSPRLLRSGLMPVEFYREFWHTILRGDVFRGEFVNRARDGRIYTEEKNVTPLRDPNGAIVGFVSTGRDITARKRVQEELDARAAQQQALAQLAQKALDAPDLAGLKTVASAALQATLRADLTSIYERLPDSNSLLMTAGEGWGEDAHPRLLSLESAGEAMQELEQGNLVSWQCSGGIVVRVDNTLPCQIGGTCSLAVPIHANRTLLGVLVVEWRCGRQLSRQDTHFLEAIGRILGTAIRRRRDEEALRSSEERYRNLCEGANDVIWTSDLEGRFTSLNRAGEQLLGYSSEEFCRLNLAALVAPGQRDLVPRLLQEGPGHFSRGGFWQLELVSRHGQHILVEASTRPFLLGDQVIGIQSIARDIGERLRLEEQLRHAQKMEAIGTLAGGIAHDFNNLLTVVLGNTELLALQPGLSREMRAYLRDILQATERASGLTRQLLAFSRRQTALAQVLDLNHVVSEMTAMLRRVVGEEIRFNIILQEDLNLVQADRGQLEQVLLNLVLNARDAIDGTGEILILTRNLSVREGQPPNWPVAPGEYVVLQVSDTGAGIDPELKDRIFEPFFTTKPVGKGSGLGLSTVYSIVRDCGGHIWMESNQGDGATFTVCLPCHTPRSS